MKTHALQDNTSKNKSASQKESGKGTYLDKSPVSTTISVQNHINSTLIENALPPKAPKDTIHCIYYYD